MLPQLNRFGAIIEAQSGAGFDSVWLAEAVGKRSRVLRNTGIEGGACVIITHGGSANFFADLFSVWACGACAVCVNPTVTTAELENIVDFVAPAAVLIAEDRPPPSNAGVPVLDLALARGGADFSQLASALDDPALILFTSGTTGTPKGVVHTFRSLLSRIALNQAHLSREVLTRSLCMLPTHFGHGLIGNALTPLLGGGKLFLFPDAGLRGAQSLGSLLADHDITFMSSVPALWKLVLKFAKPPADCSLRQINVGSAPLAAELWQGIIEWSGCRNVVNMYGITETANWFAGASAADAEPADGLVGMPWGGFAAVLREDGSKAAVGEGEIVLQTPSLMSGYFRRDELTSAAVRSGWYHSGDTGKIDERGQIWLSGRRSSEINRAGVKIQPEEIDLLLERHEDIIEACSFGLPDEISGEIVAVAVREVDGAGLDAVKLRKWCAERIKRESVPERWFMVAEIPKTDRGKVNREVVREHCLKRVQDD
jgi:acyl-CoA synthetase (AMP-forming)/AMP-acid ligase II